MATMVISEGQPMAAAYCEKRVGMDIELASRPYLFYYMLCEGVLEELYDLTVVYDVQSVPFIQVFFEQVKAHLFLGLHLGHEPLSYLH